MTNPTPPGQVPEALRLADECGYELAPGTRAEIAAELLRLHAENERFAALVEAQQPAPSAAADPMDWPLPCDVTVGHGTMCKGVSLRTLVTRMKVLYEMATGSNADEVANRTPEQRTALFEAFRAKVGAAPQPSPAPQANSQPIKTELFNPLEGGNAETALQMAAVIALRDSQPAAALEITTPNDSGSAQCIVRWQIETPRGWVGAWNREALEWLLGRATADSVTAPAAFQRAIDIRTAQGWKLGGDKVPVLYTDTINGKQVCRDDLWLCTTAAFATPPAQAADSVLEDAARLEQIAEAIRDYHHALDLRKHGGLAESAAFNSICQTMGMPWNQGEEAARRAARKQGGAT